MYLLCIIEAVLHPDLTAVGLAAWGRSADVLAVNGLLSTRTARNLQRRSSWCHIRRWSGWA